MKFGKGVVRRRVTPAPNVVPVNQALVNLGKAYIKNAPDLLGARINNARDFLIQVIAPHITALDNGLQDGIEVLRVAMDEEPQAGKYIQALRSMMDQALQIKMASFIAKQCELTGSEYELFIDKALARHKETDVNRQLLAVNDLIRGLGEEKEPLAGYVNPRKQRRLVMAVVNRQSKESKK